jgi:hypothetical protein
MKKSNSDWEPLMVGQIRKLHPSREIGSSRLVLIADKDKRDGTFLVFLLNNSLEAATPRDLCISKEFASSNYELVLMTEYFSRANPENFDLSTVFGHVDSKQIEKFKELAFRSPFGSLPNEIEIAGVSIGPYPLQKFDSIWNYRTAEFDNFRHLTYVRDVNSADYSQRFLQNNPAMNASDVIDDLPLIALFALSRSGEKVPV